MASVVIQHHNTKISDLLTRNPKMSSSFALVSTYMGAWQTMRCSNYQLVSVILNIVTALSLYLWWTRLEKPFYWGIMVGSHAAVRNNTEWSQTFFTWFPPMASSGITLAPHDKQGAVTGINAVAPPYSDLNIFTCTHTCVSVSSVMQFYHICPYFILWHNKYSL